MKKIAIIASIGLTFAAAGTLTAGLISSNKAGLDSEVIATDNTTIYFNLNDFGKTDAYSNHTSYSVWACESTTQNDKWYHASEVNFDNGVYSILCDASYNKFVVVRAKNGVWETWPNDSDDSYNQTCDLVKANSDTNFFRVYGAGGNFGKEYKTSNSNATTSLNLGGESNAMTFNFANGQFEITKVEVSTINSITISQGSTTYGYSHLEDDCKSLFNEGNYNTFSVKNASQYAFYLKDTGKIWAQIDSGVEAENWAEGFVKGVGCAAPYNAAPANWSTYAGTFATLTDGAKDTLIGATASNEEGATYVQQAAFIHDMCVRKYAGCDVFMKRDGGGTRAVTPSNSINLVENNGNNYTAIIIIAASVAVVSLSAAFIMLKKRKESK